MRTLRTVLVVMVALMLSCAPLAIAEEHASKDEAVAMVNAAVEHAKKVGPEQAFKDFSTDKAKWTKKDLYVIAFDMKGNMKAHGANEKLIGKNHMDMKDANGVFFTAEQAKVVQAKGDGWVTYLWPHPQTNKLATKSTYAKKLANYDGWVAVGIYP